MVLGSLASAQSVSVDSPIDLSNTEIHPVIEFKSGLAQLRAKEGALYAQKLNLGASFNQTDVLVSFGNGQFSPRNSFPVDFSYLTTFQSTALTLKQQVLNRESLFNFALSASYGRLSTQTKADLQNSEGTSYYIWSDGSFRNQAQLAPSSIGAIVQPDGVKETTVSTLSFSYWSLGSEFQFKLHSNWSFLLSYERRFFSATDFTQRDVTRYKGSNQFEAGIRYTIRIKQDKTTKPVFEFIGLSNAEYEALENADDDGDGIPNRLDECPFTPKGMVVNSLGCPPDVDNDGVPDQYDLELNSQPGAWVDEKGVTLSDEWFAQKSRDSLNVTVNVLRKVNKNSRPYPLYQNEWYQKQVEQSKNKLPEAYRVFDFNGDNKLTQSEMENAINDFFDRKSSTPSWLIYQAIEYIFRTQ